MSELLDKLALEYPCWYCESPIGEWCTTKSGRFAYYLHAARQDPIRQAYAAGHSQGYTDCQASTKERLDRIG